MDRGGRAILGDVRAGNGHVEGIAAGRQRGQRGQRIGHGRAFGFFFAGGWRFRCLLVLRLARRHGDRRSRRGQHP